MAEVADDGFSATGPKTTAPSVGAAAGSVLGGSLSKESLNAVKADASALSKMASFGQFAVDPEGARKIAQAYSQMLDRIDKLRAVIDSVAQAPKLGTGPYASQVAEFTTKAARGDEQSFEAAFDALTAICETAAKAYEQAAKNYNEADEAGKVTFDSAKGKL